MWGAFEAGQLQELRARLERGEYWRTRSLPAYPTREVFPLHDLAYAWQHRTGRASALGSCSRPSRYHRAFAALHPEAFRLYRLWFLHHSIQEPDLPGLVEGGRALAQVAALGDTYILSSIPHRSPGEFVYLGDDSAWLIDQAARLGGRGRALDMACGCGVIALNLPTGYTEVEGLDLSETAIRVARSNALLNPRPGVRFAVSDLWSEASGRYALVIGNPPALPVGPLFARGGERDPAELTLRLVAGLERFLEPSGVCLLTSFSAVGTLWERLELARDWSLEYFIRERIRLTDPAMPFIDQVFLRITRDGRGRRLRRGPAWKPALPWGRPEPFPQQERL